MKTHTHKLIWIVLLTICVLCVFLSGCGSDTMQTAETEGSKQTIYFAGLRTVSDSIEGVNNMTYAFQETFAAFNAESTEYQVEEVVYSDETSLQLALISGEPLDIIDLYELSTDAYIAKDIFVDLYSYLDADPELSRADFVPAFLEMAEQDGKLSFLSMAFSVRTLSAPISLVGDGQGWTVDEFAEVLAAMPEDMEVLEYTM